MNPLPPADLDALSAYLDDQLSPAERTSLESRLAVEPALREELESLRIVKQVLAGLPALRAPRNLTLTAAQAQPVRRVAAFPAFVSGLSAVAAALLLVAGFMALRPVSSFSAPPPLENAVAAAPTATWTLPPAASPSARVLEPTADASLEREGSGSGLMDNAQIAQEPMATDGFAPGSADAAFAAPLAASPEAQDAANDAMLAGAAPATGHAAASVPAPFADESGPSATSGGAELAMEAPAPETTALAEETRIKEATPTATASGTPAPTASPGETVAPAPTPLPPYSNTPPAESPATGLLLIGMGTALTAVAVFAWRRARRTA